MTVGCAQDQAEVELDPFADMVRLLAGTPVRGIVDGGAYIGTIARRLSDLFPEATVYAFEPQVESFEEMRELSRNHPRVHLLPFALGSASRPGQLNTGVLPYTSSLLERPQSGTQYYPEGAVLSGHEDINIVSLDDWAAHQAVPAVDIVKLDVQGYELAVLQGARRLLQSHVKLVYAEVSFVPLYEATCLYHDVAAYLQQLGFSLYRLYDLHHAENGQLVYGDATFISHSVRMAVLA